jgi:transposase
MPLRKKILPHAFRLGNPGKKPVEYDKRRYKSRNRIEIMFGRLKDWRRVATRYDRCPTVFLSAVALAATALFWLWILTLEGTLLIFK